MTWPLALHLPTHLPIGTEPAATLPLLNLWTLIWNAQRLVHGYAGYWDAPIFYPETDTFALSDPQPLTALLFAPLYFISENPVLVYNVVLLIFLVLNGVAGVKWAMLWASDVAESNSSSGTRNPLKRIGEAMRFNTLCVPDTGFNRCAGGILTGLFAQTLPFVTREWGVLQLTALFPALFALQALIRFGKSPTLRAALALGGWTAATFLTSSYYGLFLLLFLPLGGLIFARREHLQLRPILHGLTGVVLAGCLLAPVLPTQARLTRDYQRSARTIQGNSAQLVDYLRLDGKMWGNGQIPWLRTSGGSGQKLYPGTALLVLEGVGAVAGRRRHLRGVIFCVLGALLAFGISFGL
ncbi:MAG TPA: hypothetical protein VI451_17035, partial [Anaerolineales bacterium]|nr:hypothetical protein [Anaerolineales bacterium]